MTSYFDLLPIDRPVAHRGNTLYVRAVWDNGAIFISEGGRSVILRGAEALAGLVAL